MSGNESIARAINQLCSSSTLAMGDSPDHASLLEAMEQYFWDTDPFEGYEDTEIEESNDGRCKNRIIITRKSVEVSSKQYYLLL